MVEPPIFDHHALTYVSDRRELHAELREKGQVVHTPAHGGFWVLTDYATVCEVARDDVRFSSAQSLLIPPSDVDRLIPLQTDPPQTRTYRLALMPFFTPEAVEAMRAGIALDARACIAKMVANGRAEVVEDLALPVPGRMTMRLIGLSESRWEEFAKPIKALTICPPDSPEYQVAETQIRGFGPVLASEVDARWQDPPEDGIGRLISFRHNGCGFTRAEVVDLLRMLIFGGLDTVTGAISNIVAHIALTPDLQADLRAKPKLIPSAIEEFLRFDPPIPGFARRTTCPVSLAGVEMQEGDKLWLNWAAANQDPAQFPDPDRIDLTRAPNKHLTFGTGGHICSGARLARVELFEVLSALIEATEDISLDAKGVEEPRTIGQLIGKAAVHVRLKGNRG